MSGAARIEGALRGAAAGGRLGFVPFLTAGDPDLDATARLAAALGRAGADVIEIGIPFSDPLADGPVLQRSAGRAIASGTTLDRVLDVLPALRAAAGVPIVLFGYANPFLRLGAAAFAERAARGGADGVLITDLPPEEAAPVSGPCAERGLATIFLAAPTSTPERLATIARASTGFVYAVSRTGVTGARASLAAGVTALVARIREATDLPVAVGFGVSTPEHVAELRGAADAFVVGSAIVSLVETHGAGEDGAARVEALGRALALAGRAPGA